MDETMMQKILLVDDRPENILVLESTLDNPVLEFVKANSGEEALRQLLRNDISLILLDVQMPGMDGFEAATLIRGNPATKHIPIIFVSAISKEQKHIFKGYASGAIDYIFKPFDPDILRSKVQILLEFDKNRRMVEAQNLQLRDAKRNTDGILNNVKEGLFLLNDEFCVLPQYSSALETILGRDNLAGKPLLGILNGAVAEEIEEACKEFLEISFDPSVDGEALLELNPLSEFEFHSLNGQKMQNDLKYLEMDCRRIYADDRIDKLIFTVTDKTEKILLRQKLEKVESESRRQMDCLLGILHVDPELLTDFMDSLERDIDESKQMLTKIPQDPNADAMLEQMFRHMHQIKGNAAIMDLNLFMNEAHHAEEIITDLRKQNTFNKETLKPLCRCLENISDGVGEINQLLSQLHHIYKYFRPKRAYEIELIIRAVKNLCKNLQESTGKQVELIYNNFDGVSIPYDNRLDLKDIFVQLTRNAFHHGIESAAERKKLQKASTGRITIETFKSDDQIGFSYRDDGRGLQLEKIKKQAIKSGKWKQDEIKKWSDEKVCELIFEPGITTANSASTAAGRGVGMDVIRQMVNRLGGTISINSEPGKYTEFIISFPKPEQSA